MNGSNKNPAEETAKETDALFSDDETDDEDDFEYDENGDIIIPQSEGQPKEPDAGDEDDEEDEDDTEDDEDEDTDDRDGEDGEGNQETDPDKDAETKKGTADGEGNPPEADAGTAGAETAGGQTDAESARKDRYIASLESELRRLKSQTLDTLNKLGVKTDDAYDGLIGLAAETEGETLEEYRKRRAFAEREEEERAARNAAAFEEKMRQDLELVQAAFPEAKKYRSVKEFPNFAEFGRYRDAGLSPKKAFLASHEEEVRGSVASAVRRQALNETKNHLRSAVPKASRDDSVKMSKKELSEWRGLFPEMSDREILALYRKTN